MDDLSGALDALAVVAGELLEHLDVVGQRVARRRERFDLGLELGLLGVGDAASVRFRVLDEGTRLRLGLVLQPLGVRLSFRDRLVGGLLRVDQRAFDHTGIDVGNSGGDGLAVRSASLQGPVLAFELFDRHRGTVQQRVDFITLIATESFGRMHVSE